MKAHEQVWHYVIAPKMSDEEIRTLVDAIARNDERLCQGSTYEPAEEDAGSNALAKCACPMLYYPLIEKRMSIKDGTAFCLARWGKWWFEVQVFDDTVWSFMAWVDTVSREEMLAGMADLLNDTLADRRGTFL